VLKMTRSRMKDHQFAGCGVRRRPLTVASATRRYPI
jgi:hypothetical protein